jgi:hypothetical protein
MNRDFISVERRWRKSYSTRVVLHAGPVEKCAVADERRRHGQVANVALPAGEVLREFEHPLAVDILAKLNLDVAASWY